MKKFILLLIVALLTSSIACADYRYRAKENSFYAEFFSGANFLRTKSNGGIKCAFQKGYIVSGSLGVNWVMGWRVEGEYAYRRNGAKDVHFLGRSYSLDGHFESSSFMGNLIWDLPMEAWGYNLWGLNPFIGCGIGYDCQKIHTENTGLILEVNKKGFAWQWMAGFSAPLYCNVDVSVEYKFHKGSLSYINNHSLGVGVTCRF